MRNLILAALILGVFMSAIQSQAEQVNSAKMDLGQIYKSISQKIASGADDQIADKIQFIHDQSAEYVKITHRLITEFNTPGSNIKEEEVLNALGLLDKIVPLMKVEIDPKDSKVFENSCLEANLLVAPEISRKQTKAPRDEEPDELGLVLRDNKTLELLKKLCPNLR